MDNKPFNLQRALAGDPVVDGNGSKIDEIFYFSKTSSLYPVICSINGEPIRFTIDGWFEHVAPGSPFDLFMAPIPVEYWVASGIHSVTGICLTTAKGYESPEEAIEVLSSFCHTYATDIQTHKIIRYE
jgi:hypothetical protein